MDIEGLGRYKNLILNLVIIGVGVFFALKVNDKENLKFNVLQARKTDELKKNEVLRDIAVLEKKNQSLVQLVNNKDISSILRNFSDIAQECQIKILGIRPKPEKDFNFYTDYSFDLKIIAKSYHSLGQYIGRLESSPNIYMINNFTVKTGSNRNEKGDYEQELNIDMVISTILVKK